MSNYPSQGHPPHDQSSQDQSSWAGHTPRDEQFGRSSRDPYRDQEYRGQRRQWQQEGGRSGAEGNAPYSEREFYQDNPMNSNYGAQRGGRPQSRNEPWPRNEDRENYSAAGDYGRADYPQDNGQASTGRYHGTGGRRDYAQGNRGYNRPFRENGHNYAGHNYGGQNYFAQGDYGNPQDYGVTRNIPQPGYFQASDFSQQAGYTRSEYPEDTGYLYGQPHSRDNQQAGRALGTQDWQERQGAQRGAFGLQSTHRGRGPQGYTRSDERIKEDVCERLSEHHYIDASQIRVEVSQGVVTLEGTVDDRWQKYQTEDLVDATSGVQDIQNRLNVSRASQQSAQWTSQPATPQSASPQQSSAEATANKRPIGEKASDATRGRPGTATN
jgi:hypothetical protein